jgi:orotidine-5'-phosphate decarboxylase
VVRAIVPDYFLLVPGIGMQGGSLAEVAGSGLNDKCGLLVNSSRAIIHADTTDDFDLMRPGKYHDQKEMSVLLMEREII